jgi:hypothetical protein
MADLVLGRRMVRIEDGTKGVVAQNGPELRIVYLDRGEERLALKSESWIVDELKPGPLRPVEKMLIALHADRALRAFERNEPLKFWDQPDVANIYDMGLIEVIQDYLAQRTTRSATGE